MLVGVGARRGSSASTALLKRTELRKQPDAWVERDRSGLGVRRNREGGLATRDLNPLYGWQRTRRRGHAETERESEGIAGLRLPHGHRHLFRRRVVAPGPRHLRHAASRQPLREEPLQVLTRRLLHRAAKVGGGGGAVHMTLVIQPDAAPERFG